MNFSPTSILIPTSSRNSRASARSGVSPVRIFPPGNSQSPPSKPSSFRRATSMRSPLRQTPTATSWCGTFFLRVRAGIRFTFPSAYARQKFRTGHLGHRGARGVQIRWPSSIMPWLKSPGRRPMASSRNFRKFAGVGRGFPKSRATTRRTFPSTTGRGSSNVMLAIAAAV